MSDTGKSVANEGSVKLEYEALRYDGLPRPIKALFILLTMVGIGLAVAFMFSISIHGKTLSNTGYYYLLFALFGSAAFLILPMRKKSKGKLPWYDLVIAAIAFAIPMYFFTSSFQIQQVGWVPAPSNFIFTLALIYCFVMLEAARRMGGPIFLGLCVVLWFYPLYANHMPGILYGINYPFNHIVSFCTFGGEGIIGLPGRVMGEILIGFLIFAGMLMASGAGDFFLKLALGLLGKFRGGPAKVAVLSSGFFGSLSGSIISNIVSTGSVTIPTMKRMGYPAHYAGAIEACASTGGVLMPPVMGVVAFVMATITGIEYGTIIVAAAVPAALYYFGLLIQVDAYAAKVGLKGLPAEEIPSLKKTLKEGWPFIAVLVFLVWGLLYMRWEALSPYYASGLLFLLSFTSKRTMLTPRRLANAFKTMGQIITQTTALILPFAFILAGLVLTGTSSAFTSGLVALGGGNVVMILILGIVACYILGIMGMDLAAYIFLAISMAPALIQIGGLNVLAVHLFIIYYAMLAAITPPVAIGAFVGAAMAGASPMKTGLTAMRLGSVIYFIPLFFIFNPVLLLQGSLVEASYLIVLCFLGILFIAGGLEGYLLKMGELKLWMRPLLVIGGLAIAYPEWISTGIGAAVVIATLAVPEMSRRGWHRKLATP